MIMLKPYVLSLVVGILIGLLYAVLDVSSPAPPVIALLGLLGMQIGEHIIPVCQRLIKRERIALSWFRHEYPPRAIDTPPASGDKNT
jgi:XapX domain-containing protein